MRWRDDWWLLILAALLMIGMVTTLFYGEKHSRHGYGRQSPTGQAVSKGPFGDLHLRSRQSRIPPCRSKTSGCPCAPVNYIRLAFTLHPNSCISLPFMSDLPSGKTA